MDAGIGTAYYSSPSFLQEHDGWSVNLSIRPFMIPTIQQCLKIILTNRYVQTIDGV